MLLSPHNPNQQTHSLLILSLIQIEEIKMAAKSAIAYMMVNLAIFAFVSTNAATCPDLNVCVSIANDLVNAQFGGQTRTECCQLILDDKQFFAFIAAKCLT